MSDSNTVDVTDDLDAFSDLLFGTKTEEVAEGTDEDVSETPSATDAEDGKVEESGSDEPNQEDAPADEDEDLEDEPKPEPRGRKTARERIDELTAARREAERRAEAAERALEEERRQKEQPKQAEATPLEAEAPNPDAVLENGDPVYPLGEFDPTYISDLTRFVIKQENEALRKEAETKAAQEAEANAEQELLDSWSEKVKGAVERLPDFAEKVTGLEETFVDLDPNYGKYLASTIMTMDFGPEVLHYLAENIDEAQKIVAAGPTRATIALGRLEARFIADADKGNQVEKEKVVTSQAPPPPTVRAKGAANRATVAPDTDDLDAFEKVYFSK